MLSMLRQKLRGDLKANRRQFLAVWLVVMLGTTFYGATFPAAVNMRASFYRTFDQLKYMDLLASFDHLPVESLETIQKMPGVETVEGRLSQDTILELDKEQGRTTTLRLLSLPDEGQPKLNQSEILEGRPIAAPGEILLLEPFAHHHHIKVGDELQFRLSDESYTRKVVGLVFNPEFLVAGRNPQNPFPNPSAFGVAWTTYADLSDITGHGGDFNEVMVRLDGPMADHTHEMLQDVAGELRKRLQDAENFSVLEAEETASGAVVFTQIRGSFPLLGFFSGAFLVGATAITSILLARLVGSERQRIGTMRALGVTRLELLQHYLSFGLLVGLTGGGVGTVFGYLNSFWVMYTFIHTLVGGELPGFINRPQVPFLLFGYAVVVVGCVLAGAWPAWIESGTAPGIALRPAAPRSPSGISRLQLTFLPLPLRQSLRNLLRVPGRSASTALGVVAGAAMLITSATIWDSLNANMTQFDAMSHADYRLTLGVPQPATQLESTLKETAGVTSANTLLVAPARVNPVGAAAVDTVLLVADEKSPGMTLESLSGPPLLSRTDGVWLSSNLARVMGLNPAQVAATTPEIEVRAANQLHKVRALGVVAQATGSFLFLSRAQLSEVAPQAPVNVALISVDPARQVEARKALLEIPTLFSLEQLDEVKSDLEGYMDFFRVGLLICSVFGFVLTLAVLGNAVNASLHERREELAVLRALGATGRELALSVTLELMSMLVLGALIGVPLGRAVGFKLTDAYATTFFGMVPVLELDSLLLNVSILVVMVLLAEIPGLRAVQKLDLGQFTKSLAI